MSDTPNKTQEQAPSEMIERVARAIFLNESYTGDPPPPQCEWDEQDERICKALAQAAIEAMREPTEAMREAGAKQVMRRGDALGAWDAMVGAALGRKP